MTEPTESLWIATAHAMPYEQLRDPLHVDVAIVGGGITGLTAALLLKKRGKRVAVLEKKRIAGGESGHTTAHLTEAVDARYRQITKHLGRDAAQKTAAASRAAIAQMESWIEHYAIDCNWRRLPGFLYTERRNQVVALKSEAVSAKEAGVDASWTLEVPLPFPTRGAVRFENQAQFHPRRYLLALAAQITGDGSHLFEGAQVTSIKEGDPCLVETESVHVTADAVFIATDSPINDLVMHTKVAAYRTYAIAFRVEKAQADGLFWDTADPYHYTRWQETDEGTFLIVGGEDHKVGQETDTEAAFTRLQQYTVERHGELPVAYRWSGQVFEPIDGLPYIGLALLKKKTFIATGFSGQGMTFGTFGGMLVADLIDGRKNEYADLFSPSRLGDLSAAAEAVAENVDFPKHMILDRVLSQDSERQDQLDVASGDGKIVTVDGKKMAVHRDDAGVLHALSPVCTHLGCDVAWNNAERSWDCPCHGSRFGIDGEVLHGPATAPLEPMDLPK